MPHVHDDHDDPNPATELDGDVVRRERELPCSADDAWSLLRDAEGLERWLADEVDLVVAPGEEGTLRDGDETRVVLVESVEEGRRLSLRWWSGEGDPSVVDLTLEPVGDDASRLVVTELPLRVVSVPQAVPATWAITGGGLEGPFLGGADGASGPQARGGAWAGDPRAHALAFAR